MSDGTPVFLSFAQVEDLHRESLVQYGGTDEIRDRGQIESALGAAENLFGTRETCSGRRRHTLTASRRIRRSSMAMKRTGILAAVVFLKLNGYTCPVNTPVLYDAMIRIAKKTLTKEKFGELLKLLCAAGF